MSLRKEIQSYFHRDPAARNVFEIFFCYPGLHAILFHRLCHFLWNKKLYFIARFISNISRFLTQIEIHPGAKIGERFFIDHGCGIVIGETSEIGNDVSIYQSVTLGTSSWNKGKRHPTLEDNVVIGAGAKVLGPITIGKGAIVGSNSVVTQSVKSGQIVAGVPARVISNLHKSIKQKTFAAYGVSDNDFDPITLAVHQLLDHVQNLEKELNLIKQNLPKNSKLAKKLENNQPQSNLEVDNIKKTLGIKPNSKASDQTSD